MKPDEGVVRFDHEVETKQQNRKRDQDAEPVIETGQKDDCRKGQHDQGDHDFKGLVQIAELGEREAGLCDHCSVGRRGARSGQPDADADRARFAWRALPAKRARSAARPAPAMPRAAR